MNITLTATLPDDTVEHRVVARNASAFAIAVGPTIPTRYAAATFRHLTQARSEVTALTAALTDPHVTLDRADDEDDFTNRTFESHRARLRGTEPRPSSQKNFYPDGGPRLPASADGEHVDVVGRYQDRDAWSGKTVLRWGRDTPVIPVRQALIVACRARIDLCRREIVRFESILLSMRDGTASYGAWQVRAWVPGEDAAQAEAAGFRSAFSCSEVLVIEAL